MDADAIIELFAAFGRVSVRRLFGGFGIYADGVMFALSARGVIHLKADDQTAAAFREEGAVPFSYATKSGTHTIMSYWRLPDRLYDDPDELAAWARTALAVARRAREPQALRRPARRAARAPAARRSRRGSRRE
jgi:DNA transformation protein